MRGDNIIKGSVDIILTRKLYYRISNELNQKLLSDGWIDEVKNLTRQEMDKTGSTNFVEILNKVEPQALGLVSEQTRAATLQHIKAFLNDIVEV